MNFLKTIVFIYEEEIKLVANNFSFLENFQVYTKKRQLKFKLNITQKITFF